MKKMVENIHGILNDGILAKRCLKLAQASGLAFAGIDLKLTSNGRVYCFEVNPSPAFSYCETNTGQPIAEAIVSYLAGEVYARAV